MKLLSCGITDIGQKRKINQDAFLCDDLTGLYLVADGMGGHRGGEVASRLAVEVIQEFCHKNPSIHGRDVLTQAINQSCEAIFNASTEHEELSGMGTTVVAFLFQDQDVFVGQVGDSRAYLLRHEGIWQITEDHSLLNEEIRAGRISEAEIEHYQFKNVITRSVGYERQVVVDVYHRTVMPGDIYLSCTDGLSGLVHPKEIWSAVMKNPNDIRHGLKNLVSLANERGGDDNVTVLACQVVQKSPTLG